MNEEELIVLTAPALEDPYGTMCEYLKEAAVALVMAVNAAEQAGEKRAQATISSLSQLTKALIHSLPRTWTPRA